MQKEITVAALTFALVIGGASATRAQLGYPETVIYDFANDRYLVSNMVSGDIVEIDHDGSYTVFNSELSAVHGITISDNTLYVASNGPERDGIVGFDLTTAAEVVFWPVTAISGGWGNGITADSSGNVYLSDNSNNQIIKVRTSDGVNSVFASVPLPNALLYDHLHNRLLATSDIWGTPVYAVDLADSSVSPATTITGQFSGLAQDHLNNTYIAFFAQDIVLRVDSNLTGSSETVASGHNGPEGIFFNRLTSTLAIPSLLANQVDFIPFDLDLWFDTDTTAGWAPFEVQFDGGSVYDVASWNWDFGDGDSAVGETPTHVFDTPGLHEVTLQVVSTAGDTARRVYPNCVFSLADSVWAEHVTYVPGNDVEVVIYARNSAPLRQFQIPLTFGGGLEMNYDSFSTIGCRTEWYDGQTQAHYSPSSKGMTFILRPRGSGAPLYDGPGVGPILKLYFSAVNPAEGDSTVIDLSGYNPTYPPEFAANGLEYAPVTTNGVVSYPPCCVDFRGNVDDDANDQIDIADLVYLVDFMFAGGAPPTCWPEANIDGDVLGDAFQQVTISDLVYLADYMFTGGPAPPACQQ
jgi:hypothetical protein